MTETDRDERPCVILGSGFSRAISTDMPTMDQLSGQVLERLELPSETLQPFGRNLEQWMSYLAVEQPWLTPAENYENRALFARVSEAVQESIEQAEAAVLESTSVPDWLLRLVWLWSDQRAHIFSFNYDTLVERATMDGGRLETLADLYAMSLEWRVAAGDGGRYGAEPNTNDLPTLYKLHGSTNWYFGGLDSPPTSRVLLAGDQLRWVRAAERDGRLSNRELARYDDVVPLIIPPTLTKGPYYSNLSLRGQWRRAAEALRTAPSLTIIGYSFPAADLVARQWVSTSFPARQLQIVDNWEERPGLIREMFPELKRGDDFTGEHAVEDYVNKTCGDIVRWRVWDEGDGNGARASVAVNDIDLTPFALNHRPWTDHDTAQRWVHERVEAAEPGIIDRAKGPMDGNSEERWAVLQPGHKITV